MAALISVGFGNMINGDKVTAVVNAESAPVKRMIASAKEQGLLIDATQGRKTKSVFVMESGQLVVSGLQADTIAGRFSAGQGDENEE